TGTLGRRARSPGLGSFAICIMLAMAYQAGRYTLVSDDATLSANGARQLEGGLCADLHCIMRRAARGASGHQLGVASASSCAEPRFNVCVQRNHHGPATFP